MPAFQYMADGMQLTPQDDVRPYSGPGAQLPPTPVAPRMDAGLMDFIAAIMGRAPTSEETMQAPQAEPMPGGYGEDLGKYEQRMPGSYPPPNLEGMEQRMPYSAPAEDLPPEYDTSPARGAFRY
jgi:hypothetical protein